MTVQKVSERVYLLSLAWLYFYVLSVSGQSQSRNTTRPNGQLPDFSQAPLIDDYFNNARAFRRIHLQITGLETTKDSLGLRWKLSRPKAFLRVAVYGNDTGSAEYFPIGSYQTDTVRTSGDGDDPFLFDFDVKRILFYKPAGTQGLTFTLLRECVGDDDVLFQFNLGVEDFPSFGSGYAQQSKGTEIDSKWNEIETSELIFSIKVTEVTDHFVEEEELLSAVSITDNKYASSGIEYKETILELDQTGAMHPYQQGIDKALLQSWRHVDGSPVDGAILWVIGRTDVFMHTHVTDRLFLGPTASFKFDVYVLNWRLNGLAAIERSWLTDAFYHSHNAYGDLSVMNEEVQATLDRMIPHVGTEYSKVLGYGHSSGATVLLNYIVDHGDASFDGLLLNGPFLDLNQACYEEIIAENIYPFLINSGVWDNDAVPFPPSRPDGVPIIKYLGRDIVMREKYGRIVAQHPIPFSWRPAYSVPQTAGFVKSVVQAQKKLRDAAPITTKPVYVLSSRGDETLDHEETVNLSNKWLSKNLELTELQYNYHDVFLGADKEDELVAIELVRVWIEFVLLG